MILNQIATHLTAREASPASNGPSRRLFLQGGAAAGGGLVLGLSLSFAVGKAKAAGGDSFAPNAFIRITDNGEVVLIMPYVEMGQGTYTSVPMLIAEELEVALDRLAVELAGFTAALRGEGDPLLGALEEKRCLPSSCREHFPVVFPHSAVEVLVSDLHRDRGLKFPFEGAVEEGGEQGVEFGSGFSL